MLDPDRKVAQVAKALEVLHDAGRGFVEIRLLDPCGEEPPIREWFDMGGGWEVVAGVIVEFVQAHEGKRNAYIGRALRSRRGGKDEDVDYVTSVSIDIDPTRPKGVPATSSERGIAKEYARRVVDLVNAGVLVSSGNGFQVWIPLGTAVDIRGRREWWRAAHQAWERELIRRLDPKPEVQVDPQFDIPRIVCLPGFMKVKGEENDEQGRYYTDAEIGTGIEPYRCLDAEEIIKFAPTTTQVEASARQAKVASALPVPPKFWKLLNEDVRLYEAYNGERRDLSDPSNSTQNMALVNRLRYHGFTKDEAAAVLMMAPSLKERSTEYYLALTLSKVYGA